MNIHVPQNLGSITELSTFMSVTSRILTAQNNSPIIGIIQDGLLGSYVITGDVIIPKHVAFDCMASLKLDVDVNEFCERILPHYPETVRTLTTGKKRKTYELAEFIPGKALYSVLFPRDFSYEKKTDTSDKNPIVKIDNGVITPDSGQLCKKVLGQKANSIIHYLYLEYSPELCRDFISNVQFLVNRCFPTLGFSVGISDCLSNVPCRVSCSSSSEEGKRVLNALKTRLGGEEGLDSSIILFPLSKESLIRKVIERRGLETEIELKTESVMSISREALRRTKIECAEIPSHVREPGMIEKETNALLNSVTNFGMELSKTCMNGGEKNRISIMTRSGAKGSHVNCTQIAAFVGQQNVKGRRLPFSVKYGTSTSSHGLTGDTSPAARGHVDRPYLHGLTPKQAYQHAMGGREGLIDTAIKTANSGYAQRRLIKRMEDLKHNYDGTVRYNDGTIVQYLYGYDLFDASRLYYVEGVLYFIDPMRLAKRLNLKYSNESPKSLTESKIAKICSSLQVSRFRSDAVNAANENVQKVMRRFLSKTKLAPSAFEEFSKRIERAFYRSLSQPGDMVGIIAACSIGEPTTQGTLNSVDWKEKICIKRGGAMVVTKIGEWIDGVIKEAERIERFENETEYAERIERFENETEYVDISKEGCEIATIDEEGKASWGKITAVTRHLPGGQLIRIRTSGGRSVRVTKGESLLVLKNGRIVEERGDRIRVRDLVPIIVNHPQIANPIRSIDLSDGKRIELDELTGFFFGVYVARGNKDGECVSLFVDDDRSAARIREFGEKHDIPTYAYSDEEYEPLEVRFFSEGLSDILPHESEREGFESWMIGAPLEFLKGFLDAYFSVTSYVRSDHREFALRSVKTYESYEYLSLFLSRFDIRLSSIVSPTIIGLEDDDAYLFLERIGLTNEDLLRRIESQRGWYSEDSRSKLNDVVFEEVVSIEEIESSHPKVYDLTVEGTKNFTLFNGLCVRDTFHSAGISEKDVTLGVARLHECLDATRKPKTPSCIIHLNDEVLKGYHARLRTVETNDERDALRELCLERVQNLRSQIQYSTIKTLLKRDPEIRRVARDQPQQSPVDLTSYLDYDESEWWIETHKRIFGEPRIRPSQWVVVLEFDLEKLYDFGFSLEEISSKIEAASHVGDFSCVASPLTEGPCSTPEVGRSSGPFVHVFPNFDVAHVDDADLHTENETRLITLENVDFFYVRDVVCSGLANLPLGGIPGISRIFPKEIKSGDATEWVMDTQGCNFREVLNHPLCDYERTTCDEFWQTYEIFGIEAARETLLIELNKCLSFDGTYINGRNPEELVDSMTYTGKITNTRREGIGKVAGPLAACAFEKTMDNFASAALLCENEDVSAVSASITMGKLSEIGSGFCEVLPDKRLFEEEKEKKVVGLDVSIGDVVERY